MERCGFIGLGIMGRPMAANLLRAGCQVFVYDINPAAAAKLVQEGACLSDLPEIGRTCPLIFLILPDGQVVKEVLFGSNGLAQHMPAGSLVIDMSSVTPADSQACAARLATQDIGFLDAPVSGGEPKAVDGTLAFMAGGQLGHFERAKPYFSAMGRSSVLVGDTGSGSIAKLTNQVIVNLTIAAVSEAFVLAQKSGVSVENVYQAIRGGLAGSAVLDSKLPMIMDRDFRPGGKLAINLKDIRQVMSTAHELDVPMPFTSQLLEIMQSLKVAGGLDDDHSGIVKYFERLAGLEVSRENRKDSAHDQNQP